MAESKPHEPPRRPFDHEPESVRWARTHAGFTLTQLAHATGIRLSLLSEIEKGTRNATMPNLLKIARVLNCPVAVLERKRYEASDEEPEAAIAV